MQLDEIFVEFSTSRMFLCPSRCLTNVIGTVINTCGKLVCLNSKFFALIFETTFKISSSFFENVSRGNLP